MPDQTTPATTRRAAPEWQAPGEAPPFMREIRDPDGRTVGTGAWTLRKLTAADDEVWGALLPAAHPVRPDGTFDTDVAGYGIHTTPEVWAALEVLVARAAQVEGAYATIDALLELAPRGEYVPEWAVRRPAPDGMTGPFASEVRARRVASVSRGAVVVRRLVTDWDEVPPPPVGS